MRMDGRGYDIREGPQNNPCTATTKYAPCYVTPLDIGGSRVSLPIERKTTTKLSSKPSNSGPNSIARVKDFGHLQVQTLKPRAVWFVSTTSAGYVNSCRISDTLSMSVPLSLVTLVLSSTVIILTWPLPPSARRMRSTKHKVWLQLAR